MYEHPYLIHRVSQFETERQERLLERARFIAEHPERVVARRGRLDRMLHRGRPTEAATRPACPAAPARTAAEVA